MTKIGPKNDSDSCAIENILVSSVHSLFHASPIFTYGGESDPPSPPNDSSSVSVTPKGIPKPRNNPLNLVLYVSDYQDSEPSLSDSSSLNSSNSSDNDCYKQRQRAKK